VLLFAMTSMLITSLGELLVVLDSATVIQELVMYLDLQLQRTYSLSRTYVTTLLQDKFMLLVIALMLPLSMPALMLR
jgi:hypothetical protein